MKKHHFKNLGFSLIEMSIVLAVLGLLTGGMLSISSSRKENTNVIGMDKQFDIIDEAVKGYITRYGYLPCPASLTAVENTTSFGTVTDCSAAAPAGTFEALSGTDTIRIGALPVRSLMLPDKYGYDKWGIRLTYVVIKELAKTTATLDGYTTSRTDGVIKVTDYAGNQVTEADATAVNAYLIVSHSKDKRGGYSSNAQVMKPCSSTKDVENCDNDNTFIDSEVNESETDANFYYDFVHWKSLAALVGTGDTEDDSITNIYADYRISCVLRANGEATCVGRNDTGQLGDGTTVDKTVHTPISTYSDWKSLDLDGPFTCGIRGNDEIFCWGDNTYGSIGDNTTTGPRLTPTAVNPATGANSGWSMVDIDIEHACGLRSGHLLCWGHDHKGQVGNDTTKQTSVNRPTEVQGAYSDWQFVALGWQHTCGIRNGGRAYCWGQNDYGQIGNDASGTDIVTPTEVYGGYTNWSMLASNDQYTCGLRSNGTAWCWGSNWMNQLGDNSWTQQDRPVRVKDTAGTGTWYDWISIGTTVQTTCGLRGNGKIYCWGLDNYGQLGNGAGGNVSLPTEVSGGFADWQSIDMGRTACGLRNGNVPYCWGENDFGQTGNGGTTNVQAPVAITNFP